MKNFQIQFFFSSKNKKKTVALGEQYPEKLVLGMELRDKVCRFVKERIQNLREQHQKDGKYQNIAVERANCMKSLPCYFRFLFVVVVVFVCLLFFSWHL